MWPFCALVNCCFSPLYPIFQYWLSEAWRASSINPAQKQVLCIYSCAPSTHGSTSAPSTYKPNYLHPNHTAHQYGSSAWPVTTLVIILRKDSNHIHMTMCYWFQNLFLKNKKKFKIKFWIDCWHDDNVPLMAESKQSTHTIRLRKNFQKHLTFHGSNTTLYGLNLIFNCTHFCNFWWLLPSSVDENMSKLKFHLNLGVLHFCFKSLSLMEGPKQPIFW